MIVIGSAQLLLVRSNMTHPDSKTEACRPSRVSDVAKNVSGR